MKKFSLFLSLMFCVVLQAWAGSAVSKSSEQHVVSPAASVVVKAASFTPGTMVTDATLISEGYAYVIRSARGFLLYSADQPEHIAGSAGSGVSDEGSAAYDVAAQQFQFKTNGSNVYLFSIGAGKYVKSDGSYEDTPSSPVTFVTTGNASYPFQIKIGTNYINMQASSGYDHGCAVD